MDFIKSRQFFKNLSKNINIGFSVIVGVILGITYGAGVLIKEAKNSKMSKKDTYFVAVFLMVCHAIIEDTLLFAIFGADIFMVVAIRTILAVLSAYVVVYILSKDFKKIKNK